MILFDLDGTLADSMAHIFAATNALRFIFRYPKLDQSDPRLKTISGQDFVRQILKLNTLQFVFWLFLLKCLANRNSHKIKLFPGIKAALRQLKKTHHLGIITSAPKKYTHQIIKNGGIDFFDRVVTDVRYHDKARHLKRLMKEYSLSPKDLFYVGDEKRDADAAKEAGVPFVAVLWGKDDRNVFKPYRCKARLSKPSDFLRTF
jgi:phosphoglycolate phosphatase